MEVVAPWWVDSSKFLNRMVVYGGTKLVRGNIDLEWETAHHAGSMPMNNQ